MGPRSLLFTCVVLSAALNQGSTALTPVFVKTGDDVQLNVTEPVVIEELGLFAWIFKERRFVRYSQGKPAIVSEAHKGRIKFHEQNYSLIVKNLQKSDSGLYSATVTGEKSPTVAEYDVTVLDPVSAVGLKVNSVSNSSESCNLTVSCSAEDSRGLTHINSSFRCDARGCSQEGGEASVTASGASLQIYLHNDRIVCNHSNQVSLTENKRNIQDFCPRRPVAGSGDRTTSTGTVVGAVLCGFGVVSLVLSAAVVFQKRQKKRKMQMQSENTIYSLPQGENMAPAQTSTPVTNDPSIPSNTTYCTVGPHTGPTRLGETQRNPIPESLYASVDKPARS